MEFKIFRPKSIKSSFICAKAQFLEILCWVTGASSILSLAIAQFLPDEWKPLATHTLESILLVAALFGIDGARGIVAERLSKGDVFTPPKRFGPNADTARGLLSVNPTEIDDLCQFLGKYSSVNDIRQALEGAEKDGSAAID